MPTISRFFGIAVKMYHKEHAPPHFHALYGSFAATIDIRTMRLIYGRLPRRAMAMVLEWAVEHRDELLQNWALAEERRQLEMIAPLE